MSDLFRNALLAILLSASPLLAAPQPTDCPPPPAPPTQEQIQDAMRHTRDRGFLWRISKDGHDSWLYGTIHVAKFEWMFPGPAVMKALDGSDVLALELDMMDADIRQRVTQGMSELSLPADTALPAALTARLRKQADASCMPYDAIAAYPGEMQLITITLMKARLDGLESAYAIDAVLSGIGHAAQKEVISLETPESQIATLKQDDEQAAISYMETSLEEMETGKDREQLRRIAKIWDGSDSAELARYELWCDCVKTPEQRKFMHKLLDERNPALADKIDAQHRSGKKIFAAVGSLHMFGDGGLPALMAKRGYRVQQIDFTR
ncbi:MAG: TraB/GumN family protein [Sideroxydans sp.]|nr:TraB/GumN family protein [Sideroxydans sp.]